MGQVLAKDKIGALSQALGTITLAPSRLTIGGQQYVTSALNVAANLSVRNTRYQIYAVISGGSPILVISTNENSVGPVGYNSWKLVGSYYTDGMGSIGFGSFVNIVGPPKTNNIIYSPNTFNLGATSSAACEWSRDGQFMNLMIQLIFSAAGSAAGAGIGIPLNTTIATADLAGSLFGHGSWFDASVAQEYVCQVAYAIPDADRVTFVPDNQGSNLLQGNELANGDYLRVGGAQIPIVGWSNTSIEDL
jgi:hypothetical protein